MVSIINELFDEIEPFNSGMLKVSDIHNIYYEESGNKQGVPVLLLHGGPGACCNPKNRRRFNPEIFRIILFDQRGCGKSTPNASLEENNTEYLIADIEKLRKYLNIDKWMVTGGSWGSTLALVYAESHPEQILAMVLNGIFLAYDVNTEWLHGTGGVARVFPEAYEEYINFLPESLRGKPLEAYNKIINGSDKKQAIAAAVSMLTYEGKIMAMAENTIQDEIERKETEVLMTAEEKLVSKSEFEAFAFTHSKLEGYYSSNSFFMEEDRILDNVDKIKNIPITLIHGRYDMVCPIKNAYKLHEYLPNSEFIVVPNAAHSTSEMLGEIMTAINKAGLILHKVK